MKNIVIFGSVLILVICGCRHNDKISKLNSSNEFNCILDSSYSEYLLNNNSKDTIIRFWKLLNYGPISLIEINLKDNEMHYYQIDKMNLTSKEEKYMGWYNSKHKNVMIRFFHLDSLRINYSKIITELKKNQAIDDYKGGQKTLPILYRVSLIKNRSLIHYLIQLFLILTPIQSSKLFSPI